MRGHAVCPSRRSICQPGPSGQGSESQARAKRRRLESRIEREAWRLAAAAYYQGPPGSRAHPPSTRYFGLVRADLAVVGVDVSADASEDWPCGPSRRILVLCLRLPRCCALPRSLAPAIGAACRFGDWGSRAREGCAQGASSVGNWTAQLTTAVQAGSMPQTRPSPGIPGTP